MSFIIPITFDGTINVSKRSNESRTRLHSHSFLELVYVCSGEAEYHIAKHSGKIRAGDYFIIDYETEHDYLSKNKNLTIINVLFLPELIDETFAGVSSFEDLAERYFLRATSKKIKGPAANQVFHDDGTLGELFLNMLCEYEEKRDGYLEILRFSVCRIIIETVRKVGSKRNLSELTEYLIKKINSDYQRNISLSSLVSEKHYSLSYASSRFKEDMGITFTEHLQNRRIEEACRMLRETDLSIAQISEAVGYTSIKFFNQIFKTITKISPRDFRKQHR